MNVWKEIIIQSNLSIAIGPGLIELNGFNITIFQLDISVCMQVFSILCTDSRLLWPATRNSGPYCPKHRAMGPCKIVLKLMKLIKLMVLEGCTCKDVDIHWQFVATIHSKECWNYILISNWYACDKVDENCVKVTISILPRTGHLAFGKASPALVKVLKAFSTINTSGVPKLLV